MPVLLAMSSRVDYVARPDSDKRDSTTILIRRFHKQAGLNHHPCPEHASGIKPPSLPNNLSICEWDKTTILTAGGTKPPSLHNGLRTEQEGLDPRPYQQSHRSNILFLKESLELLLLNKR